MGLLKLYEMISEWGLNKYNVYHKTVESTPRYFPRHI